MSKISYQLLNQPWQHAGWNIWCPAQIALKLQGNLKNAHVQGVAPSGDGGVNCKQW